MTSKKKPGLGAGLRPDAARAGGGGRKVLRAQVVHLRESLKRRVELSACDDPQSGLRWTCMSARSLSQALRLARHPIGTQMLNEWLAGVGCSLQANRNTREESAREHRDEQSGQINAEVVAYQERAEPIIPVDTKKKELIGDFNNGGREWRPKARPEEVRTHIFIDRELGKVNRYGVYDHRAMSGWSVSTRMMMPASSPSKAFGGRDRTLSCATNTSCSRQDSATRLMMTRL